nr:PREDICTED: elongation factor Ts, mitochondrial [Lepisosteus oculatus]
MSVCSVLKAVRSDLRKVCLAQPVQSVHSGCPLLATEKALLVKLRKVTGYSFVNCKKALEKFDGDFAQAESWLHEQAQKEGWSKANKLQGRRTSQGLIGQLLGDRTAVMVEVNCETDFVARNETFQQLVHRVALATMGRHQSTAGSGSGYTKVCTSSGGGGGGEGDFTEKHKSHWGRKATVGNHGHCSCGWCVPGGQFSWLPGEIPVDFCIARRAARCLRYEWMACGSFSLCAAVWGLLVLEISHSERTGLCSLPGGIWEFWDSITVVGEAPETLGTPEDLPGGGDTETRLLAQSLLSQPDRTVGQYLQENGAHVLDFVRFECGEAKP